MAIIAKLTVCYDLEAAAAIKKITTTTTTRLSEEIQVFDSTLGEIQTLLFPNNLKVCDRVCEVRDALFRLESQMRGCEVVEFCCSGLYDFVYQKTPNDKFWDKAKQDTFDSEEDETLKEDEF
jgi:hypothetical protein